MIKSKKGRIGKKSKKSLKNKEKNTRTKEEKRKREEKYYGEMLQKSTSQHRHIFVTSIVVFFPLFLFLTLYIFLIINLFIISEVHHILYLFAELGDRATTEKAVRTVMEKGYGADFYAGANACLFHFIQELFYYFNSFEYFLLHFFTLF